MKLLIVLAALCIVSIQGFVKRDAPVSAATPDTGLSELEKQLASISKMASDQLTKLTEQAKETFNLETIKKNADEIVTKLKTSLDQLQKPTNTNEAPKA